MDSPGTIPRELGQLSGHPSGEARPNGTPADKPSLDGMDGMDGMDGGPQLPKEGENVNPAEGEV